MICVRVELWSAATGEKTELARMHICNVGGDLRRRDYSGETFKGRSTRDLDKRIVQRKGGLTAWRSLDLHVWNLVAAMLAGMGYGDPKAVKAASPSPQQQDA